MSDWDRYVQSCLDGKPDWRGDGRAPHEVLLERGLIGMEVNSPEQLAEVRAVFLYRTMVCRMRGLDERLVTEGNWIRQ